MYSIQVFMTFFFISCVLLSNNIHAQQENQPTSSTAIINTASGTTQSIIGTPLPYGNSNNNNSNNNNNNNNNSSAAAAPTNGVSGHGAVVTPSQPAAPHSSFSPSSSGGASNTTRPPQVAPFPDDTVGKNGRLRVSSMGNMLMTPGASSFIILFSLSLSLSFFF
ncbi:hypothetical protein BCR42DRAFT_408731 [Absidia repens]|uniref:Uncharacterized protein n=1 Tax=Absidia repens TaxID=90262 RepID=A0A1X2IQ70_9FUNG|nr:hypothetical protein BCR42DRAFT_408731 [Absidia repens]